MKYLKFEFWKGDIAYFSKPSLWQIIKYELGIGKPLILKDIDKHLEYARGHK